MKPEAYADLKLTVSTVVSGTYEQALEEGAYAFEFPGAIECKVLYDNGTERIFKVHDSKFDQNSLRVFGTDES